MRQEEGEKKKNLEKNVSLKKVWASEPAFSFHTITPHEKEEGFLASPERDGLPLGLWPC